MKQNMYSVYDRIAQVYTAPVHLLSDEVAIRVMKNCVHNPEHNYSLNPEDYALYKVGEFDDNLGQVEISTGEDNNDIFYPVKVVDLITLKKGEKNEV